MNLLQRAVGVLAVATLVPISVSASPAAAATTVTFPSIGQLNPDLVDYTVHVETDETGVFKVYATGGGAHVVVDPVTGDAVPEFLADGLAQVYVERCVPGSGCQVVAQSNLVEVYDEVVVQAAAQATYGPRKPYRQLFRSNPGPVDLAWRVVDPLSPDDVIASGRLTTPGGFEQDFFDVALPDDLPDGTYELRWSGVHDSETFGHLENELEPLTVHWLATPPTGSALSLSRPLVYPVDDGFQDSVKITYTVPPGTAGVIEMVRPDGTVAYALSNASERPGTHTVGLQPSTSKAGQYVVRLTVTDKALNTAVVERPLEVRTESIQWTQVSLDLPASKLLLDSDVGSCSTLARLPKGALGLYSRTRCQREKDSGVAIFAGVKLRESFTGTYANWRFNVLGGRARGERSAYVILQLFDEQRRKYVLQKQLDGPIRAQRGLGLSDAQLMHHAGDDRNLYWAMALTAGSRFDVQRFRVRYSYQTLR